MRDDSAPLRKALCDAAQLDASPDNAERAMAQLAQHQPQALRRLLQQHLAVRGDWALTLLEQELAALGVRVEKLEADVASHDQRIVVLEQQQLQHTQALLHQRAAEKAAPPPALSDYLVQFWDDFIGALEVSVPARTFIGKVVEWFKVNG